MKPNDIIELPHVDEDGYWDGPCACMVDANGDLMLGADTYNIAAPEDDGKHFYKLSADKTGWVAEAIPTTAEECVGIVLDHHKQTDRVHKLRVVFDKLTQGSTTYRLVQDATTNARTVEKIPEKTPEEQAADEMSEAKAKRAAAVAVIKVTVDGMEFDGDEESQSRMARAITAAEAAKQDTTVWVLANNVPTTVTKAQLSQALALSMQEMAKLWTVPYENAEAKA